MSRGARSQSGAARGLLTRARALAVSGLAAVAALGTYAGVGLTAGCLCPSHPPEALTNAGFRTPRQTYETFLAAFDYRIYGLEYRCLSAAFKARNRLSTLAWREFRDQLERDQPFLRLAARAEIVEERREAPDVHWIVARAAGRTLRLRFVREEFVEIYCDGVETVSTALPPGAGWTLDPSSPALAARVPLESDQASTLNAGSISEFRMGYEWKLDDFVEDPSPGP